MLPTGPARYSTMTVEYVAVQPRIHRTICPRKLESVELNRCVRRCAWNCGRITPGLRYQLKRGGKVSYDFDLAHVHASPLRPRKGQCAAVAVPVA
jgi:hypothetical protein